MTLSTATKLVKLANQTGKLQKLRHSILDLVYNPNNVRLGSSILSQKLEGTRLQNHWPIDIDCQKLAEQDPKLERLKLADLSLERKKEKIARYKARGKKIWLPASQHKTKAPSKKGKR